MDEVREEKPVTRRTPRSVCACGLISVGLVWSTARPNEIRAASDTTLLYQVPELKYRGYPGACIMPRRSSRRGR